MSAKRAGRTSKAKTKVERQPGQFFNRELSWLAFNERVLEEAADTTTPLLERVKFAAITASNLDEFVMVRVAGLRNAVRDGDADPDAAGLSPSRQLAEVSAQAHRLVERLYTLVVSELLPALAREGIHVATLSELAESQRAAVTAYFREEVLPVLTPLAIDAARPFPMLSSLSLNLALCLAPGEDESAQRLAIVQVPSRLPRLVRVLGGGGKTGSDLARGGEARTAGVADPVTFVWLEAIILAHLETLFPGQQVIESAAIRLSRDAELELDDEGGGSYVEALEEELRQRRRNDVVRLEVEAGVSRELLAEVADQVDVRTPDIYRVAGPVDLRALMTLVELPGFDRLRDIPQKSVPLVDARDESHIFETLDSRDLLLHHPYDSFDPVVALVDQAAEDPDVLAIKMTLYRPGTDSPIIRALERAADQGKQVTVVVELMARFDEERNIKWARALEESGAHVIYGIRGLKVHAKICLVVRRTAQGIRRYVHLGTGNYNHRTARLYVDMGLMTSRPSVGVDASAFFNALTGFSDPPRMEHLVMAPTQLRERVLKLVERETRRAQNGQPALIRAKMNALVDERVIQALYRASGAGVTIQLNIRGTCMLRPGVARLSERISVVSIVGRFLEHTRVFHFHNGGDDEVYLSSADWMPRNLDRRIELAFPVDSPDCRRKVLDALDQLFKDNVKSRRLGPDGVWKVPARHAAEAPFLAQQAFYDQARRAFDRRESASPDVFDPITSKPAPR
ncbi:MAG: polyphosphate kinase 1 [Acidobacteria bacterium]|nr:polyphosphate kinase 1 [Acidobacteriota bacterium]